MSRLVSGTGVHRDGADPTDRPDGLGSLSHGLAKHADGPMRVERAPADACGISHRLFEPPITNVVHCSGEHTCGTVTVAGTLPVGRLNRFASSILRFQRQTVPQTDPGKAILTQ